MSLYQVLFRMITTNLHDDDLQWSWLETLFFFLKAQISQPVEHGLGFDFSESKNANVFNSLTRLAWVHLQNAIYVKKSIWTRMTLHVAPFFVC